jgi:hypothetical protein
MTAQTIEATGKRYKFFQSFGVFMILVGVGGCSVQAFSEDAASGDVGSVGWTAVWMFVVFVGLILYVSGRIGAWWKHG